MVINPSKDPIKNELKYLGYLELKVPTQFILKSTVTGRDNKGPNDQVLHDICLKINHKLGGVNHALSKRPLILDEVVMLMGADVIHPASGDVSKKPSIAAVVGSTDLNFSQYNGECRLQGRVEENSNGKWRVVEEIKQMENIAYSLLSKFKQERQRHPEQIIYYRDGVSEGEFPAILNHELSAIRRACARLKGGCEPKVTFIIA